MMRWKAFTSSADPVALVPKVSGMSSETGLPLSVAGAERAISNRSMAGINGLFGLIDLQLVVILSK